VWFGLWKRRYLRESVAIKDLLKMDMVVKLGLAKRERKYPSTRLHYDRYSYRSQ
jgi:hypothetical protein